MAPEQEKIVAEMGFEVCEFGPDPSEACEGCVTGNLQLYFQGPTDAGRYLCLVCILAEHAQNEKDYAEIMKLENDGHTNHCGCRQVWGDGQCECGKQGIIPGNVSSLANGHGADRSAGLSPSASCVLVKPDLGDK